MPKASSTLATIVAVFAQTPLLRFVVDLLYRRVGPTRRRACVVHIRRRFVVPVTCSNNMPTLQHGGFYGQIC